MGQKTIVTGFQYADFNTSVTDLCTLHGFTPGNRADRFSADLYIDECPFRVIRYLRRNPKGIAVQLILERGAARLDDYLKPRHHEISRRLRVCYAFPMQPRQLSLDECLVQLRLEMLSDPVTSEPALVS